MKREHNEQSQLPSGYRRLEYIESTGTQYIDTGLHINIDSKIVCDGIIAPNTRKVSGVDTTSYLFGERYYNNRNYRNIMCGDGGTNEPFIVSFGGNVVNLGTDYTLYNNRHIYEISKNGCYIDGTVKVYFSGATFSAQSE